MSGDISTTNVWLSVIAIATVIQVLGLVVAVIVVARFMKRASATIETVERQVQPVVARATASLDDAKDLIERLKRTQEVLHQSAERVLHATESISEGWQHAKDVTRWRMWPVIGLMRGASAAVSALTSKSAGRRRTSQDRVDEDRFVYEGGTNARDFGS